MELVGRVDNRFEIEHLAGVGGMGCVYRAIDHATGTTVALKVVEISEPTARERFSREARVLQGIQHPGVVRYVAHGELDASNHYLAMEWLEGEDLAERLRRGPLDVAESLRLVELTGRAVAAAHAVGVIHRDIKPSNLFLVGGAIEGLRVLDFGVARKSATATRAATVQTSTGAMIGTPAYMAPEQVRGERHLDARVDVFALGCVAYECLTGAPPFSGEHVMAVLAKVLFETPPRPSAVREGLPRQLDAFVERMLAKDPARRPLDGVVVADEALALAQLVRAQASATGGPAHLGAGARAARPAALTTGEQRLVGVVLSGAQALGAPGGGDSGPLVGDHAAPFATWSESTTAVRAPTGIAARVKEALAAFGALGEIFEDGSVVAVLSATGGATDLGVRTARAALALRGVLPDAPIALSVGRGVLEGAWPIGEALDRAAELVGGWTHAPWPRAPRGLPVLLDPPVRGLLDDAFELELEVDSATGRCVLWAERGQAVGTTRAAPARRSTFVGREAELARLEATFARARAERRAQAVLVTGQPGVGKRRLVTEFLARLEKREASVPEARRAAVWITRGDPVTAATPFGLVRRALRGAFALREGEPAVLASRKVVTRVAQRVPASDRARVVEFLGELLGVRVTGAPSPALEAARRDPRLMGACVRDAWETFLRAETAARPLVLVLEHAQWSDSPSTTLVGAALEALADQPLVVVGVARPEIHETYARLRRHQGLYDVSLGPLERADAERIARELLADAADPRTLARVVELGQGNAFYVEELARQVRDAKLRGVPLDVRALPETVLATAQARLEALPVTARRTLRAASVFGQACTSDGVTALLDETEHETTAHLRELVRLGLLAEVGDATATGQTSGDGAAKRHAEFVFRHAITREAAYATLTDADRALGHRLAAAHLASRGSGDGTAAVVLAWHFDSGSDPDAAAAQYRRAAEEALAAGDLATVVRCADRGRANGASGQTLGELCLLEAEAAIWQGRPADGERLSAQAIALLPPGSAIWSKACAGIAFSALQQGNAARAFAIADELARLGTGGDASASRALAWFAVAVALSSYGQIARARVFLGWLHELARATGDAGVLAWAELMSALDALHATGDFVDARRAALAAREAFARCGERRGHAMAEVIAAWAEVALGDARRAEAEARRLMALSEEQGWDFSCSRAGRVLVIALTLRGALHEALEVGERVLARMSPGTYVEGLLRFELSATRLTLGDREGAEREALAALAAQPMPSPARAAALAALARVQLARGAAAEAHASALAAMRIVDATPEGTGEADALVRLAHAEALAAVGDATGASLALLAARTRLLERADRIGDPHVRAGFLRGVAVHARTLDLFAEWSAADGSLESDDTLAG